MFEVKIGKELFEILLKLRRWYVYRKSPPHFLSPNQYYAEFLDDSATVHHRSEYVGREGELTQVLEAVDSEQFRIISISGSPGNGLSRFLLEFSKLLEGRGRGPLWYLRRKHSGDLWKVYFARKGGNGLLNHLSNLRKGNVVIMFDSPQDEVKEVAQLIEHAPQARNEGRIVVVTGVRKAFIRNIQQAFVGATPGSTSHHELAQLSRQNISDVIKQFLPTAHPQTLTHIKNLTQDSVFLTVLVCQTIKQNSELLDHITDPGFVFRVCIQPMKESVAESGIPEWQCGQIFAAVAVLYPFDTSSDVAVNTVTELTNVDSATIQRLLNSAVQAGLFEKYASKLLRPIPELFGTLLIEQACIEEDGSTNEFGQILISRLLKSHPQEVIENTANVGWSRGNPLKLVKEFIRELRGNIQTRIASEQEGCLGLVQQFAPVDPLEVMDYVELLVTHYKNKIVSNNNLVQEWEHVFSDVSPLLVFCGENPQSQSKALEIARILYVEGAINTKCGDRTVDDCLEKIVGFSPLKSIDLNRNALKHVRSWLRKDEKSTKAALTALGGLIKTNLEWEESDGFTFTWSKQLIPTSDEIKDIRNEALTLLCNPEFLISIHTTTLAFSVVDSVGDVRSGPAPTVGSESYEMLQNEEKFVLRQLSDIYDEEMPVVSRVLLEKHLWTRWAWGSDGVATVAEKALERCADSAVHRLQRLLLNGDVPVVIEEILREYQEGEQKRLDTYLSDPRDERENSEQLINELIEELNYGDNSEMWFSFLRETSRGVNELSWKSGQFIYSLAKQFPATAWEIFDSNESGPWTDYKSQLLSGLRKNNADTWLDRLETIDASVSDLSIVNWLHAIEEKNTDKRETRFIKSVSATEHEPIAAIVVSYLTHSEITDWYFKGDLLFNLVEKFPTKKNVDKLFYFLSHKRPEELRAKTGELDERALQLLLRKDLPHNVPWIDPCWIGPYFKTIAVIDPSKFLNFLNDSVNALDESKKSAIEILESKNADEAMKVVIESSDKSTLIDQFIQLSDSPKTIPSKMGINLLSRNFKIDDVSLQNAFKALLEAGKSSSLARILGGMVISETWLNTLKVLVISCIEKGGNLDDMKNLVWPAFYTGVTTRSPGYATPRDLLVAQKMIEFLAEDNLPALARSYFEELKNNAEVRIQDDLHGDERQIGRKLTTEERGQQKE